MPDRRRDNRYKLTEPIEGTFRMFLDVVVQQFAHDEWIALSREPAMIGETLVLDAALTDADGREVRQQFPVYVTDSQPMILNGDVRHRIRLRRADLADIPFEQPKRPN